MSQRRCVDTLYCNVAIINASRMLMSGMDGNGELGLISIEDRFHHHAALLTDLLADRVCG